MSFLLSSRRAETGGAERSPWLDGEFVECHARWREESLGAREAYEQWRDAEPDVVPFAYAAYVAALDREERAAHAYRDCADRISRRL